jgi:Putative auto-transporter adhesin, head GIN domain
VRVRRLGLGLVLAVAAACSSTGATTGSPKVVTTAVPVESFTLVQASDAFEVNVTIGPSPLVELHVNENLLSRVDVTASGGTLSIGLKPGPEVQQATLQADVTAPELTGVDASGAAHVHLHGTLADQNLTVTISGSSGFDGTLSGGSVSAEVSGNSLLLLAGTVQALTVSAGGASQVNAGQLKADQLTIDLSGASQGQMGPTTTIAAQVSGASTLVYQGTPTFTKKEVSGGSTIQPA